VYGSPKSERKLAKANQGKEWSVMEKNVEEAILATLQDILIFQMASKGVPQSLIRHAVGLKMGRVSRIAKLAKNSGKWEE
jgi:hypothetical protein